MSDWEQLSEQGKIAILRNYCDMQHGCDSCPCKVVSEAMGLESCRFDYMNAAERNQYLSLFAATDSTPDNVNHPKHYELPGGIECIDVLVATQGKEAVQAFCICNAMKYIYRHKRKNGVEDIEKARWYLNKYIELEAEDHGK